MSYVFPAALVANGFAMSGLMILLGLAGQPVLAAEFGIVHGAAAALFGAFSANARSLILRQESRASPGHAAAVRLLLMLPLAAAALWLSLYFARVEAALALTLIVRRGAEWLAEIHLSEAELAGDARFARRFLVLQAVSGSAAALWLACGLAGSAAVLGLWAISPLLPVRRFARQPLALRDFRSANRHEWLPHLGSTAVIGIAVYVFRLLILLLAGKAAAGDLYTAFAIGGMLGSVFAQAVGPTLVLQETRGGVVPLRRWAPAVPGLAGMVGVAVYAASLALPLDWLGKTTAFWSAAGLSLAGGAIMVVAQLHRLRILQKRAGGEVFGPDMLSNLLVIAAVPYVFYLFGVEALGALYCLSAISAWLFYRAALLGHDTAAVNRSWAWPAIAIGVLLPLFGMLNGSVFRETSYVFDTAGQLSRLPLPLSVAACYAGILLIAAYARARLAMLFLFATFTLMLLSTVLLSHVFPGGEQAKLILLIQVVLPMFALVLGQLFAARADAQTVLAKGFAWTLALVVPWQLLATWADGMLLLSPSLGAFSIYQHLQYVPTVFVAAYVLCLFSLWSLPRYRMALLLLAAPMACHAGGSVSALATAGLLAGVSGFALWCWRRRDRRGAAIVITAIVLATAPAYFLATAGKVGGKYDLVRLQTEAALFAPKNFAERLGYWRHYLEHITASPRAAALGHAAPPDRARYPSAHNYFLDFTYNFGLLAMLPLLGLITLTLHGIRRAVAGGQPGALIGLAAVVVFLVLVDNMFKVGLRQPYPGIFTFFLWGLLLSLLFDPDRRQPGYTAAP